MKKMRGRLFYIPGLSNTHFQTSFMLSSKLINKLAPLTREARYTQKPIQMCLGKKGKEIITQHKYDINNINISIVSHLLITSLMLSKVTDSSLSTEPTFFGCFFGLSYLAYSTGKF